MQKYFNTLLHTINKLFNITSYEWWRVLFSFLLKTLVFTIYVISNTLLIASFLESYWILKLPILYIILAISTIIWSIWFSFLVNIRYKKRVLIWLSVFAILWISIAWIAEERSILFFWSIIFFIAVIINQIKILLWIFIEELFSPLESERAIPFVEAAEPIWWIIAGTLLALWVSNIEITWFFKILIFMLIFFMFTISLSILLDKTPRLKYKKETLVKESKIKKIYKWFKQIKWTKFLKFLSLIVFFQFIIFTIIEFQYTSALDEKIKHKENIEIHQSENSHSKHDKESYSSQLAHWLWFYHILFSILLFLSQILISWRLNKKYWIVKTMSFNPLLMIIPSVALLSSFWIKTAVFTKASFEILNWIYTSAFSTLWYASKEQIRDYSKEFNWWIITPLWTIIWTIILLLSTYFLHWELLHSILSIIMIIWFIFMFFLIKAIKDKYTQLARKKAETSKDIQEKIEAIEVLTQKWHHRAHLVLSKLLAKKNSDEIKWKILYSLWKIWNKESIPDILDLIKHEDKEIQKAALNSLLKFKINPKNLFEDWFTKFRILEDLKKLFSETRSKTAKELIVKNFSNIHNEDIIPFIISILENSNDEIKKNAIYICKNFNDINLTHYIQKFLNSENPQIKASVIIALWQFEQLRLKLTIQLSKLLLSKNKEEKLSWIFILWEIKSKQEINKLYNLLNNEDDEIRRMAIISILKLWEIWVSHHIIEYLLNEDKEDAIRTKKMLQSTPENIIKHINNLLKHEIIIKIKNIIKQEKTHFLEKMPKNILENLIHYYYIIDEHDEVIKVKHILNKIISEDENKKN